MRLGVDRQRFGQAERLIVATLGDQGIGGERPAALDLAGVWIAAAHTKRVALEGEQLALEHRQVGKVPGQWPWIGHLRWLHLDPGFTEQHAAAPTVP